MNENIAIEKIDSWVGNQGYSEIREEFMLKTIWELLTSQITIEELRKEIISYE